MAPWGTSDVLPISADGQRIALKLPEKNGINVFVDLVFVDFVFVNIVIIVIVDFVIVDFVFVDFVFVDFVFVNLVIFVIFVLSTWRWPVLCSRSMTTMVVVQGGGVVLAVTA